MPGELVSRALRHAWIALNDRGLKACLMGGMAMAHWGHARFTRDVDLLVSLEPQSVEDLAEVLSKEGFTPRHTPLICAWASIVLSSLYSLPRAGSMKSRSTC